MVQQISTVRDIEEGLVFIPDISGFTELVHNTDAETGWQITAALLSVLIEQNSLGMQVAEIEGDAILFYLFGAAPSSRDLQLQYEGMAFAFERKRLELELSFEMPIQVSLKAIAHYGKMTPYRIGGFDKLYGKVLVEAHRLLKNSIRSGSYLLLTDALINKTGEAGHRVRSDVDASANQLCERYESLRHICFTYFDYDQIGEEQVA